MLIPPFVYKPLTLILPHATKVRRKVDYWKFTHNKIPRIKFLNLELTNHCNLHCRYCIRRNSNRLGFIEIGILEKLINEINQGEIEINNLSLYDAGEPLLHPRLKKILDLIQKAKKTNKLFPRVGILTNGTPMLPKMQKLILKSEAVDDLGFSIDGGNKKDFEYIRRGAKWETVIKNAESFINLNNHFGKKIKINIISIFNKKPNLSPEFMKLTKEVDNWWPVEPHTWDGSKKFKDLKPKGEKTDSFCHFIFENLAIKWDGRVSPCCNDLNNRGTIGDFKRDSLRDIYFGEPRKFIISKMARGKRKEIPLCKNCAMS
jgi:radical SAM protein with 4Fe4S-binding SPASM domain